MKLIQTYGILFALSLLVSACGEDSSGTGTSANCSALNGFFVSQGSLDLYDLTFASGSTLSYHQNNCTSQGSYTCQSNTQMTWTVSAVSPGSAPAPNCEALGTYTCTIANAGGFLNFGCSGSGNPNQLSPSKNFQKQ